MRWKLKIRRLHRWLSIVLGIQILFWMLSGAYFSLTPLDRVHGTDRKQNQPAPILQIQTELLPITRLLHLYSLKPIREIRLKQGEKGPYYALYQEGQTQPLLINAFSGERLPPKTLQEAIALAKADYRGEFQLKSAHFLEKNPADFSGAIPVYQIQVDDARGTRIYVSPNDGSILARRNRWWRVFDFLWMLHILDFKARTNFNNGLLRILALAGICVVLSGFGLWATSRKWPKTSRLFQPDGPKHDR